MPPLASAQFAATFLPNLQAARNEDYLCDCRLVVRLGGADGSGPIMGEGPDGTRSATLEFPAHRIVLAASSPFFRQLFALKRHEAVTTVAVSNVSVASVEVVLHFLYSGDLRLGPSLDPAAVLALARIFQIGALEGLLSEGGSSQGPQLSETPPALVSGDGKRRHSEAAAATSPSLLKRFCGKAVAGICASADSGSDLSVPYGAPEAKPPSFPPLSDHDLLMAHRILATQAQMQQQQHLAMSTAGHFQPPSGAELQLEALRKAAAQMLAAKDESPARTGYFGPLLPTRPQSYASPPTSSPLHSAPFFNPAMLAKSLFVGNPRGAQPKLMSPKAEPPTSPHTPKTPTTHSTSGCHSNGLDSRSSSEQAAVGSPDGGAIAGDSGIMVPSNDKEGWCRNKKYIQKVGNGFKCTVCQKVYGRYNSVSYHVTIYHRNPPIRCDEPGCQFTTREARYIHFHKYYRHGTALPETIDLGSRSCPFCRHVAKSPAMLEKHVARHMPPNGSGAARAPSISTKSPNSALEEDKSGGELNCDQCSYKGQTESSLEQHKLFKHSRSLFGHKFTCDVCQYNSATKENLDAHRRRHHIRLGLNQDSLESGEGHSSSASSGDKDSHGDKDEEDQLLVVDEEEEQTATDDLPASAPPPSAVSSVVSSTLPSSDGPSLSPSTDLDDSHSKLLVSEDTLDERRRRHHRPPFTTTVNYGTL